VNLSPAGKKVRFTSSGFELALGQEQSAALPDRVGALVVGFHSTLYHLMPNSKN
jgi:hypothetical protein